MGIGPQETPETSLGVLSSTLQHDAGNFPPTHLVPFWGWLRGIEISLSPGAERSHRHAAPSQVSCCKHSSGSSQLLQFPSRAFQA